MIILIHVIIAIASMVLTASNFVKPTSGKLRSSYLLIASTLVSGTFLVISSNASILRACVTGLVFITVTSIATASARKKLVDNSLVK